MKTYTIDNKPDFADQEKVLVDMHCFGLPDEILEGKIVGKSSTHIIDQWIIQFNRRMSPEYIYTAMVVPHTFIVNPIQS